MDIRFGRFKSYHLYILYLIGFIFIIEWFLVHPYGEFNVTYYDELADAFLAGQLHLLRPPPPELLALPDPWDPIANSSFRLIPYTPGERFRGIHDLALYNNKLYVQWGPLPALILIPLRWIAGHDLPMGYFVLIIAVLAALAYATSIIKLARLSGFLPSKLMEFIIILLFMLCPFWEFALRRIAVYETAVFFAQLCMSFSLLSFVIAFDQQMTHGRRHLWLLALGSSFMGLMVDCRPELAPLGLMVPILFYLWWRCQAQTDRWRAIIAPAAALGGPAAFFLGCTLLYNQIRFGSITESGQDWILWSGSESIIQHKFQILAIGRIIPNIWYYFLAPVTALPSLPILFVPTLLYPHDWMSADMISIYYDYVERTSGLFVVTPFTILVLLSPLVILKKLRGASGDRVGRILALLLLSGLLSALLFLSVATLRYGAEWCMWWLMASVLIVFWLREMLRALKWSAAAILFDTGLILSTAWSSWVGVSFLLTGINN